MNIKNIVNQHPAAVAIALFINFVMLIGVASHVVTDELKNIEKTHAFENLHSIGKLKTGQIQRYFQEREGDALFIAKFLSRPEISRWLANPSDNIPVAARRSLEDVLSAHEYGGLMLLDSRANIRFGTGKYTVLSETGRFAALRAIQENRHVNSPIYFGDPSAPDKPFQDIFAPIVNQDTSAIMGVLVLRDDMHFLYSLIQSWPIESESGETLLVTRDGDQVLFLNELRFKKDTALKLRLPIENSYSKVPTVEMLGKGHYGQMEGMDYRGRPVLAYNIAVPDTSWGMVVKMNEDEVLKEAWHLQKLVWVIDVFFILGAGVILLLWWKKQRSDLLARDQLAIVAEDLRISAIAFETQMAMVITDTTPKILRVNKAFEKITGYAAADAIGQNPRILSSPEIRENKAFYEEMWADLLSKGRWNGELLDKRKDGVIYPKQLTITAVNSPDGATTHYVGSFIDITARKQAEDEINRLAFFDQLTGLPNRRLLLDRLQHALASSARSGKHGAIMFIDLDNFKVINDTKGHDCGDLLLIEIAQRLQSCVREGDTVARLGGDEFVVMLEDLGSQTEHAVVQAEEVGEKICAIISRPCIAGNNELLSTASIGISLFIDNVTSAETLLKNADIAMYQAKESGRNAVRFFDPAMQIALEVHAAVESDLRHALAERQFSLYYQAQVDNKGSIIGAEGLLRWIHPQRGVVFPVQFIHISEESSLIIDIGDWVLDTACRQLNAWGNDGQRCNLVLSVNVSARQFKLPDFVDKVTAAIETNRINPQLLKLELTESVVLENVVDIVEKMHALKALGVGLSMDDFGTGYSSLSYLKQLPIDQIKIDQSFVRDIVTDPNDAILVKSIIDLAHNFHMDVIAEGVENEEQLAFLKNNGCNAYQGYFFSKAMLPEEFEALLGGNIPLFMPA